MSEWCVCSASHGQPPGSRSRLVSWTRRTSSRAAPHRAGVDEHRREVVGLDRAAVELLERDHRDLLVGEAEALQHRDRRVGVEVLEQRELHVGQHERVVALRDQEPAARARRRRWRARRRRARRRPSGRRRAAPTRGRRTTRPRPVPPRRVGIGAQQRDRALGDRGTARHRVDDLAVLVRGGDQRAPRSRRTPTRGRAAAS